MSRPQETHLTNSCSCRLLQMQREWRTNEWISKTVRNLTQISSSQSGQGQTLTFSNIVHISWMAFNVTYMTILNKDYFVHLWQCTYLGGLGLISTVCLANLPNPLQHSFLFLQTSLADVPQPHFLHKECMNDKR